MLAAALLGPGPAQAQPAQGSRARPAPRARVTGRPVEAPRPEPETNPEAGETSPALGLELGPLLRIGARAVPGGALRAHLRVDRVVTELGLQVLRQERWRTDPGGLRRIRRRVPLTLSLRAARQAGPVTVEGGVGMGLTVARIEQHPADDPAAGSRGTVLAGLFRFEVVARWAVAEDLYLSLPFTIAVRAATWLADEAERRPASAPHMEVGTGLAIGLGRP